MWGRAYFQPTPSSKPGMVLKFCRTLPTNKASRFHARFSPAQDRSWTFCLHLGCSRLSVKWSLGRWAFGSQIPPGHLPWTSHPRVAPCFSREYSLSFSQGHPPEERSNPTAQSQGFRNRASEMPSQNFCKIILLCGTEAFYGTGNSCVLIMEFSFFPTEKICTGPVIQHDWKVYGINEMSLMHLIP